MKPMSLFSVTTVVVANICMCTAALWRLTAISFGDETL